MFVSAQSGVHTHIVSEIDLAGNASANTVEVMVGDASANTLTALHAGDILFGGGGGDTFVFDTTTASGSVIQSFTSGVDHLQFTGFNAGAQVIQQDATHWQVSDGIHTEIFQLANGAHLAATDYLFH
jgi:Ca2+-binding RTX toxin-like protein